MNVLTSYTLAVGAWNTWPYLYNSLVIPVLTALGAFKLTAGNGIPVQESTSTKMPRSKRWDRSVASRRAPPLRPLLGRLWNDFLETHKTQSLRLKVLEMNLGGSRASAPEQFESQGVLEPKG